MTKRLVLTRLVFTGPTAPLVELKFEDRLNVVFGASNTGKSFASKAIDFGLGAGGRLPDIDHRRPYDKLWLTLACDGQVVTLARGAVGGNLNIADGTVDQLPPKPRVLGQKNDATNENNVSQYLLSLIGLRGKQVATHASGARRPLSFRDIARFCIVDETSILSEASPAQSGQRDSATVERSVFKLLLTGIDDSAVVPVMDRKSFRTSKAAKVEMLNELISSMEADLEAEYPDAAELKEQHEKLEDTLEAAQADVDSAQQTVRGLLLARRVVTLEFTRAEFRLSEIEVNLKRFAQLHQVYQSDIDRLEALEEAGFVLAIGGDRDCPLCGASPDAQQHEHGLGDIARIRAAALIEIAKIKQQQAELSGTVQQLYIEGQALGNALPDLASRLQTTEARIAEATPQVAASRTKLTTIVSTRDRVKRGLSLIEQRDGLKERKASLEATKAARAGERPNQDVSSTATHDFAQVVSRVLAAWKFPGKRHVSFDDATFDLKIDGKHRRDNGKGVRAITHAAFKVALLIFCRERRLPHPGFLLLDTPLLTYRDPLTSKHGDLSSDEKAFAQLPLRDHFFEHLSAEAKGSQFIVLENVDLPASISSLANVEVFHGEGGAGRPGLFPSLPADIA